MIHDHSAYSLWFACSYSVAGIFCAGYTPAYAHASEARMSTVIPAVHLMYDAADVVLDAFN